MEKCPKCGVLLEVIECCGGGIYRCDVCGEYFFFGDDDMKEWGELVNYVTGGR